MLAGAIPFAGGALGAAAGAWSEHDQQKVNELLLIWLKQLEGDLREMGVTLADVLLRLDLEDERVKARLASPEYQSLVSQVFRNWTASESKRKREMFRNLLTNAVGQNITGDDVISLFIIWIGSFNEMQLNVIATLFKSPGITRLEIWRALGGGDVADNSAEADLFKYITSELQTSYVIRQDRPTTADGQFLKQRGRSRPSATMKTPFDDEKPYVLTGLGSQFVHYALSEIVPRLSNRTSAG